jgi:lysophospholipase L1-like esterase
LLTLSWLIALGCAGAEPGPSGAGGAGQAAAGGEAGVGGALVGGGGAAAGRGGATPGSGGSLAPSGGAGNPAVGGSSGGGSDTGGSAGISSGGSAGSSGAAGSGAGGGGEPNTPLVALTIYLAGDSTVSTYTDTASPRDQAGWGQMLQAYLDPLAKVDNRAVGGRTSRRFIEEGTLDEILSSIKTGDYLFVQFGTNDSNKTATYTLNGQTIPYYLEPSTDFKTYIQKYVDGARHHGAIAVLVTPPPRNSAYCTGGNGTGAYAQALRELGQAQSVAVVDLNKASVDYLKAICPSPTPEDFFLLKADGTVDGTHFQENGARILAGFVADGIEANELPLARYLE